VNRPVHQDIVILLACLLVGCQTGLDGRSKHSQRPVAAVPFISLDRSGVPSVGDCEGLPRAAVAAQDPDIECIGILDTELSFPRGVVGWADDILLVDKGAHLHQAELGRTTGKIYRYVATDNGYQRQLLIEGLDNPSSISRGRHAADSHLVYISTPTAILRLAPDAQDIAASLEQVVTDLPLQGWHYLSAAYATARHLYVSVPSASDHCEGVNADRVWVDVRFPCPELETVPRRETASIRRYAIDQQGQISKDYHLVAHGLRDALALVQVPGSGNLLAADNGWDDIDLEATALSSSKVPHDEVNLIEISDSEVNNQPLHYGWPYCFDRGAVTPGYEAFSIDCAAYQQPLLLLPAHSAPLAMLIDNNQLLINLHGFEIGGRRTLAVGLSANGLPTGAVKVFIDWNFPNQFGYLWGRPFGLAKLGPRALIVTDDWNHALLKVVLRTDGSAAN